MLDGEYMFTDNYFVIVIINEIYLILLQALVDEDLLIYEAFCYQSASDVSHLKLRFKKVSLNCNIIGS